VLRIFRREDWANTEQRDTTVNQKKILVVDDDRIIVKTTASLLAAAGYTVITAEDGAAAVEKARLERPDLILLDMIFPPDVGHGGGVPWDGFLIIGWIRRIEESKDIPVVLVTGADPAEYRARGVIAGVKAFLHKPVNKQDLLATISQVLGSVPPPPTPQPASGRKRVLFVDDEGDWREVVGNFLKEAGFEVVTAGDVAETFMRSQKTHLDAIVLDVNLAGENSALLMQLLKLSHPGVPIIVYTGLEEHDEPVQKMLKQGARQYLRKGTLRELCEAVRQAVN
jgi:DNA-binding response OmpR family regulator